MRLRRWLPPTVAVALTALPALAFHSGGVGACSGCHQMHEKDGKSPSSQGLLLESNPTDLCLRCHATENGNTWGNDPLLPGPQFGAGSFVFLRAQNLNDGPGGGDPTNFIPGAHAGHNVISVRQGTSPDPEFASAPGGTYPANRLYCTSCHDPHGKGGHYRLLYGSDSSPSNADGYLFSFARPAPQATGVAVDEAAESDSNHNAYLSGMSEWCANCHESYLSAHADTGGSTPTRPSTGTSGTSLAAGGSSTTPLASSAFTHPVSDPLGTGPRDMYNRYLGTGSLNQNGDGTQAYIALVPLEFPENTTGFRGPIPTGAKITCVTCHRAHASSGPRSGRWDFKITTWAEEGILSGTYPIPNPYASTAGTAQRRLCDKCHGDGGP